MQRRLIVRPAEAHDGADDQRKDADRREHVIKAARARRNRGERDRSVSRVFVRMSV